MKTIVTAALPYVNNVPHLGNILPIISADVYARYLRSKGESVLFVCGTDEHGTTTETKAKQEGVSPRALVDKYFAIHKEIYEWFSCSFDVFGRSSDAANHNITHELFQALDSNGYIMQKESEQMYDEEAQTFLADRFVVGTCPHCGFEDAKGDQCDSCGKLLTPTELKNPRSTVTGAVPELRSTTHLYIDLEQLQPKLEEFVKDNQDKWSQNARTITQAWLKEGLQPRAITRDLSWGVKVPKQGFDHKVFYSWFDAPIAYMGISAQREDWEEWWKDSRLVQFMGKDNVPFHTILFPAFIIGSGKEYSLLDTINANEYINYEDGKFSKSRGIGVFGDGAIESGIPTDVWRYYLMAMRPEKEDTQFVWDDFAEKTNKELLANLGNLINRTLQFVYKYFDGVIPDAGDFSLADEYETYAQLLEKLELRQGLKQLMHISKLGNQYFQEQQPWVLVKENKADAVIGSLAVLVRDLAILMQPYLPNMSAQVFDQFQLSEQTWKDLGSSLAGHKINEPRGLVDKLDNDRIEELRDEHGGSGIRFSDLDLRVGVITQVTKHPEADKLFVEHIDMGDHTRQIVSGLVGHYEPDDLIGKHVVVVANLATAKLRGQKSEGMLLAAGKKQVGVLVADAPAGTPVVLENKQSNPKDSISFEEFLKVPMLSEADGVIHKKRKLVADGKPIKTHRDIVGKVG